MWVTLELTAPHDGAPAARACAGDLPPWGDRDHAGPLGPSASGAGLFGGPIVSARPPRARTAYAISAMAHVAVGTALVLVPLFSPAPPVSPDYIRVLIYDPPPAPPLPLPKGSLLVPERQRPKAKVAERLPDVETRAPTLQAPIQTAAATLPADQTPPADEIEAQGSPSGADSGAPEGMEGGVEGGMVGGIPGGVLGGVVGGSGQGVVLDYDRAPRLLRQTRPRYPQEAFVKKVEGTVLVEFVIDATGRVVAARVLESVPLLDAAALEAVRDWVFDPAFKHGIAVATVARAPVAFRIF